MVLIVLPTAASKVTNEVRRNNENKVGLSGKPWETILDNVGLFQNQQMLQDTNMLNDQLNLKKVRVWEHRLFLLYGFSPDGFFFNPAENLDSLVYGCRKRQRSEEVSAAESAADSPGSSSLSPRNPTPSQATGTEQQNVKNFPNSICPLLCTFSPLGDENQAAGPPRMRPPWSTVRGG